MKPVFISVFVFAIFLSSCSPSVPSATITPTAPAVATSTKTRTPVPTRTLTPTETPDPNRPPDAQGGKNPETGRYEKIKDGVTYEWFAEQGGWFRSIIVKPNYPGGMNLIEGRDIVFGEPLDMITMQVYCEDGIQCPTLEHRDVYAGSGNSFTTALLQIIIDRYGKDTGKKYDGEATWYEVFDLIKQGQLKIEFTGTDGKEYVFRPRNDNKKKPQYTVFMVDPSKMDPNNSFPYGSFSFMITGDNEGNVRTVVAADQPLSNAEFLELILEPLGLIIELHNPKDKIQSYQALNRLMHFLDIGRQGLNPHFIIKKP